MTATLPIRRPARIPDYDYATPGAYFVTVCCQKRNPYFEFKPAKSVVETVWRDIPNQFANAGIDVFVVMPDHFHGIIIMKPNDNETVGERPRALPMQDNTTGVNSKSTVGERPRALPMQDNATVDSSKFTVGERPRALPMRELTTDAGSTNGKAQGPSPTKFGSVIDVVQWFKSLTTAKYRHGVKSDNWPPYFKKLWQRSFYDHVIRNETDLAILRDYILNNPAELAVEDFFDGKRPDLPDVSDTLKKAKRIEKTPDKPELGI